MRKLRLRERKAFVFAVPPVWNVLPASLPSLLRLTTRHHPLHDCPAHTVLSTSGSEGESELEIALALCFLAVWH